MTDSDYEARQRGPSKGSIAGAEGDIFDSGHKKYKHDGKKWGEPKMSKTKSTMVFCPMCETPTHSFVKDSRPTNYSDCQVIRRRRTCEDCGGKFTTLELPTSLLDDTKLRAEILKRVFDLVYTELMQDAPTIGSRFTNTEGDGE